MGMNELSIFIDESGDFGEYDFHSPYYIIAMVMHDQSYDITEDLAKFEKELHYLGYSNHCVHVGPIIRQEQDYRFESMEIRQRILKKICVRLPVSWAMSKITPVSLFRIGLATPISSLVQIFLCVGFIVIEKNRLQKNEQHEMQNSTY